MMKLMGTNYSSALSSTQNSTAVVSCGVGGTLRRVSVDAGQRRHRPEQIVKSTPRRPFGQISVQNVVPAGYENNDCVPVCVCVCACIWLTVQSVCCDCGERAWVCPCLSISGVVWKLSQCVWLLSLGTSPVQFVVKCEQGKYGLTLAH